MSTSQKILLAVLAVVFVLFIAIYFGINNYNDMAQMDAAIASNWSNFEKTYQPRFELIQRLSQRVEALGNPDGLATPVRGAELAYSQARTVEQRVLALIGLEGSLKTMLDAIKSQDKLKNDSQTAQTLKSLDSTRTLLLDAKSDYNEAVTKFDARVSGFPASLLAGYYGFAVKTPLPEIFMNQ